MSTNYSNTMTHNVEADLMEVGDLIRQMRESKKMTQLELSEKAGLGEKTLSRLETGKSNMRLDTFFALVDVLGISPNDISPPRLTDRRKDCRFFDLESEYNLLSEVRKQFFLEIMVFFLHRLKSQN